MTDRVHWTEIPQHHPNYTGQSIWVTDVEALSESVFVEDLPDTPPDISLRRWEDLHWKLPYEVAGVFTNNLSQHVRTFTQKNKWEVFIPDEIDLRNRIFTHNHPILRLLSINDIRVALKYNLPEMRCTFPWSDTQYGVCIARIRDSSILGWDNPEWASKSEWKETVVNAISVGLDREWMDKLGRTGDDLNPHYQQDIAKVLKYYWPSYVETHKQFYASLGMDIEVITPGVKS